MTVNTGKHLERCDGAISVDFAKKEAKNAALAIYTLYEEMYGLYSLCDILQPLVHKI